MPTHPAVGMVREVVSTVLRSGMETFSGAGMLRSMPDGEKKVESPACQLLV